MGVAACSTMRMLSNHPMKKNKSFQARTDGAVASASPQAAKGRLPELQELHSTRSSALWLCPRAALQARFHYGPCLAHSRALTSMLMLCSRRPAPFP